jgi:DNA-directed RNA polymerase subunit RPC12/RpoP
MKIIKRGKIKSEEHNEVCHKCSTEFTYVGLDIHRDREGNYVICPVCGAFIAV